MGNEGERADVLCDDEERDGDDQVMRGVGPREGCAERVELQ